MTQLEPLPSIAGHVITRRIVRTAPKQKKLRKRKPITSTVAVISEMESKMINVEELKLQINEQEEVVRQMNIAKEVRYKMTADILSQLSELRSRETEISKSLGQGDDCNLSDGYLSDFESELSVSSFSNEGLYQIVCSTFNIKSFSELVSRLFKTNYKVVVTARGLYCNTLAVVVLDLKNKFNVSNQHTAYVDNEPQLAVTFETRNE